MLIKKNELDHTPISLATLHGFSKQIGKRSHRQIKGNKYH